MSSSSFWEVYHGEDDWRERLPHSAPRRPTGYRSYGLGCHHGRAHLGAFPSVPGSVLRPHLATGAVERSSETPQDAKAPVSSILRGGRIFSKVPRIKAARVRTPGRLNVVELEGFEPSTFSMPLRRAPNCAIAPYLVVDVKNLWWSWRDSNPRPRHCERRALPTKLQPHNRRNYSIGSAGCQTRKHQKHG